MFNTIRVSFKRSFSFKLASRIACSAVMLSAALWLNASARAESFTCVLATNTNTGSMSYISCGSSAGDILWACEGGANYCTSDPQMDYSAHELCDRARANGCPQITYYAD